MRYLIILCLLFATSPAWAKPIDADLAVHQVEIDHTFQGLDILLFGARNDAGQIVVQLLGEQKPFLVRKKKRIMGVWANAQTVEFPSVPTLYQINSTVPLDHFENQNLLRSLNIGIENMPLEFRYDGDLTPQEMIEFREALIAHFQRNELYSDQVGDVEFWGETLFRAQLLFPKKINRGFYTAETYLMNDTDLSAMQSTPIEVRQIGMAAFLHDFAYEHSWLYGILCVIIALVAGWAASSVFGRVR